MAKIPTPGRKAPAFLGMAAPLIFVFALTLLGFFRKGYDPMAMHVSALSLGADGWTQMANFMVFGVLALASSLGLVLRAREEGRKAAVADILLMVYSVFLFFSGPFVMDPMDTPAASMSPHGIVHGLLGGLAFMLMPTICYFDAWYRAKRSGSKAGTALSLSFALFLSLALLWFTAISKDASLHAAFRDYQGFFQRLVLVPFMAWLFTRSLLSLRDTSRS